MRPKPTVHTNTHDLFKSRLDQFIDMKHRLVVLAHEIDWDHIDVEVATLFPSKVGRAATPSRFMIGLLLLKSIYNLSDEQVCDHWVVNPYFQYFTGGEFFEHSFPHDRTTITKWRGHLGDKLEMLLAESLRVAFTLGALSGKDLSWVTVDTTVMEKNVSPPSDAKLLYKSLSKLRNLSVKHNVPIRQSYIKVGKRAAIMAGRYAHAKQFKRMRKQLRFLSSRLGRVARDLHRNIHDKPELADQLEPFIGQAFELRRQLKYKRGRTIFSLHAPEVECIGKGKTHKPYEFGCKVSIATTNARSLGGQFAIDAVALHGKPHDGHTLKRVLERIQTTTNIAPTKVFVDKGYGGHGLTTNPNVKVYHDGLKGLVKDLKKAVKRRAAVEPLIGHLKSDGHLGRNYLKGKQGDRINALMAAVGYNFRLILKWIRTILRFLYSTLIYKHNFILN